MLSPVDVYVEQTRDGIKILVDDRESDSLVIVKVQRRYGSLGVRLGLRGNFDVRRRPMRWMTAYMDAPGVSEADRAQRKADALRRADDVLLRAGGEAE